MNKPPRRTHRNGAQRAADVRAGKFTGNTLKRRTGRLYSIYRGDIIKYETILKMPDSKQKFLKLERKLLQLQYHGEMWNTAREEWKRLFEIYRGENNEKNK